ncbi:MAG: M16 family metallopeptidase [Bacteroidota bacterium]
MKTLLQKISIILLVLQVMTTVTLSADDLDRTKRPAGKPAPVVQLPAIQKAKLKNGLNVWLVELHKLPYVSFALQVQAGSDQEPVATPGLASLTASMLNEGTKTRDALKIADDLEKIGASVNSNANIDFSFITLGTLPRNLDPAIEIFCDVITHPAFSQKDLDRLRKQRLTQLIQQKDSPVAIANNSYSYILYSDQHPYGNNSIGTESSLKAFKPEDLKAFYDGYYRPNNATMIVVGDAKLDDITAKLEKGLADWQGGDVKLNSVPPPQLVDKMRVYLIDKPGAAQSEIRIGNPSLSRTTPDYFAVQLMNQMLGGQFTSRINLNLREKHGYTYGARSVFQMQKGVGPFTASSGVITEKTDSSVIEFLNELNAMHDKGLTADELEYAKKGMTGSFALSFETPAQVARALANIVTYNLPEDYYQKYLQNIESVKLDEVQNVAKKYLDTSKMAIVIVGDLSKIREGILKLNLGEIVNCDVSGKPLKKL